MPLRLTQWLQESREDAAKLAEAIRELVGVAVTALASPEALRWAATEVARVTDALRPHVPEGAAARYPRPESIAGPAEVMPFDPVMGALSPLAPPLLVEPGAAGILRATVTFGTPYEGPPGCVHGGVIAACFDQVLNVANLMAGVPGPTKSLEVRYRKPTPVRVPLVFEANPPAVEGNRVTTTGVLRAGETVVAEATGIFIVLPLDRVMALTSERR
jgi:acyl-coenzyme A thioesterase PaaI-like protein